MEVRQERTRLVATVEALEKKLNNKDEEIRTMHSQFTNIAVSTLGNKILSASTTPVLNDDSFPVLTGASAGSSLFVPLAVKTHIQRPPRSRTPDNTRSTPSTSASSSGARKTTSNESGLQRKRKPSRQSEEITFALPNPSSSSSSLSNVLESKGETVFAASSNDSLSTPASEDVSSSSSSSSSSSFSASSSASRPQKKRARARSLETDKRRSGPPKTRLAKRQDKKKTQENSDGRKIKKKEPKRKYKEDSEDAPTIDEEREARRDNSKYERDEDECHTPPNGQVFYEDPDVEDPSVVFFTPKKVERYTKGDKEFDVRVTWNETKFKPMIISSRHIAEDLLDSIVSDKPISHR